MALEVDQYSGARMRAGGEPDAGCCGMAGSFGLETAHYELSMQI